MKHEWTTQGLGMIRLYLPGNRRLHVWSSKAYSPKATLIHTHPWDFESRVLRGWIYNYRYRRVPGTPTHDEYLLKCGAEACLLSAPSSVRLCQVWAEDIGEGQTYSQAHDEIHESLAEEGTVTIITRKVVGNPDHASVFTDVGVEWSEARPRPSTKEEVELAEKAISGLKIDGV